MFALEEGQLPPPQPPLPNNRKTRRWVNKMARRKTGGTTVFTGQDVSTRAFKWARDLYGPGKLSPDHAEAIMSIAGRLTHLATGHAPKALGVPKDQPVRLARGLQCGGGKTLTAKAWMGAVHALGKPWSVAFAANEVEALCRVKNDLIETFGVPEEKIGLLHRLRHDPEKSRQGKDGYASLPATPDDQLATKQFLLVTHNMIRTGKKNVDRYNVFRGKPRDLVIYDESMLVADASSLRSWHVRQASD